MRVFWPLFAVGVLLLLAIVVDIWLERRQKHAHTVALCDGADWEEGVATPCMKSLTARDVHRVARVQQHSEDGVQGGSAALGAFCQAHCPGDCQNARCRLTAAHP